jgi:class 3 adenylate cyclase
LARQQHAFTLRFRDEGLERAYRDATADGARPGYRILMWIVLLVFTGFSFVDPTTVPGDGNYQVMQRYRLALGGPLLALSVAIGYAPARWFRRAWAQAFLAAFVVAILTQTFAAAAMPHPEVLPWAPYGISLLILLMGGCMALPVGFVNAAIATVLSAVPVVIVFASRQPVVDQTTFWFSFGALVALLGAWQIERRDRLAFLVTRQLDVERARSERLLRNVLPEAIAERLKDGPVAVADGFDGVTVLFADLVGFTPLAAALAPDRVVEMLNQIFTRFDELAARHHVEKIKTIGDAYMLAAGVPSARRDHAQAAAEIALDIRAAVDELSRTIGHPLQVRIGLCSGPAVAGVIGLQKFAYDLWGDTVNTAARMESHGTPGEIQVAESTYVLLQGGYAFDDRGVIDVKGKGPMRTFFLRGRA